MHPSLAFAFLFAVVPPMVIGLALWGFWFGSRTRRDKSQLPPIAKYVADFKNEHSGVRLFYIVLFGILDGLLLLKTLMIGTGISRSSDPAGMGDAFAIVVVPVLFNFRIMIISLLATPFIRRASSKPWAQSHVRNSLVLPGLFVIMCWLFGWLGEYLNCWKRLLRP